MAHVLLVSSVRGCLMCMDGAWCACCMCGVCSVLMRVKPLSEDLFRLLSVPARVQDGATAAAVRISGDG
jgi:hypothetical protein